MSAAAKDEGGFPEPCPEGLASGMRIELSSEQHQARQHFQAFVQTEITPYADLWDRQQGVPLEIIDKLREQSYLGAPVSQKFGGGGMDAITYGLLTEEIGRGCSSVRSLLTVHDMVSLTLARWGRPEVKAEWLSHLARGDRIGALALSETEVGSDAANVQTRAQPDGTDYVLNGTKKWITFGQIADVYLVLAQCQGQPTAFLVPAEVVGFSRHPMHGVSGTRASLLAELCFEDCRIPGFCLVGRPGFGLSHVMATALDHGRYSVAWGSVGIAQACLDASLDYTSRRQQFGVCLNEHQLVQRKLTEMIVNTRAARLLCYRAGYLRQEGDPGAIPETMIAKYYASRTARRNANDAVQLHGANGLSEDYPVERYLRDAKVMELIEGSSQIQQIMIPRFPLAEL